jgi:long-chain acyl-CoA synthetase
VIVPLNIRWSIQENADAMSDCGAKLLVVDNAFAKAGMTLATNASGSLMLIYADDDPVPDGMFGYESLSCERADAGCQAAPDDLAAIYYTGGTTGRSKGVVTAILRRTRSTTWRRAYAAKPRFICMQHPCSTWRTASECIPCF